MSISPGPDPRGRNVGQVGPSRGRSPAHDRLVVPLDPQGGEVNGDAVELIREFFATGFSLLERRHDHVDERILARKILAVLRELGRQCRQSA